MNHRLFAFLLSLAIIAAVVGALSVTWKPNAPKPNESGTMSATTTNATAPEVASTYSLSRFVPGIEVGPDAAEGAEGVASAHPTIIAGNETTNVTVTIPITDSRLIPGSVNLQRLDVTGKVIAVLGTLNDAGTGGDAVAGDKTFSIRQLFHEAVSTSVRLRVSWALSGVLRRAASPGVVIDVRDRGIVSTSDVSFTAPPQLLIPPGGVTETERDSGTTLVEVISATGEPSLGLLVEDNPENLSLTDWFSVHVDHDGVLLSSGTFGLGSSLTGAEVLSLSRPVPDDYDGAPLAAFYVRSPGGNRVVSVIVSQDNDLEELGYPTPEQRTTLLRSIVDTLEFK